MSAFSSSDEDSDLNSDSGDDQFDCSENESNEQEEEALPPPPQWTQFDSWDLMADYVKYLPLHTIMTNEYRSFVERFLPDIITGHSRSQVMNQHAGTEHKYYYKNLRIAPPIFRNGDKGLCVDSFSQAFKRKSTLSCIVMADVYHEMRVYQDCLDLEDVYNQHKRNYEGTGWRAIKGRVKGNKLHPQNAGTNCPPISLPRATASKFRDKGIVIICPYPNVRTWGQAFKFDPEDVFEQRTRKPFPEYDQRLLLNKTLTVNSQVPLFDLPLLMGVFAGVPLFCTKKEERSPVTASFVVNGLAKSIFMQFRLIPNVCFVFKVVGKEAKKYRYNCEIRSLGDKTKWKSTSTLYIYLQMSADRIFLHVPCFSTRTNAMIDMPLLHAVKMLGIDDCESLVSYLYPDHVDINPKVKEFMDGIVSELDFDSVTIDSVLEHYSSKLNKSKESVQSTFDYSFLSHCDYGDKNESKLHFFAACLRKLAAVDLGLVEVDDRDHIANKQVQCAGQLLAVLKRQLWRNYNVEQGSTLSTNMQQQKVIDINAMLATRSKPTSKLMHHFHSGQWSVYNNSKQGYLQLKTDTNDFAAYEQLGRVSKPVKRDVKSKKPRFCPPSAMRHLCVSATPDGAPTGLVNNSAINCRISAGADVDLVAKIVHSFGFFDERAVSLQPRASHPGTDSSVADAALRQGGKGLSESRGSGAQLQSLVVGRKKKKLSEETRPYHLTVYINGNAVGCLKPDISKEHFIAYFRACRRKRIIPRDVSIHYDDTMPGIMIRCDIGRMMTVLLIVSELKRVSAVVNMCRQLGVNIIQELFVQGCAEFVDCFETEHSVTALDPKQVLEQPAGTFDYCALDYTCIFGLSASHIPSAHRNQAPRVSYHSAGQTKGALQETKDIDNARFLAPTNVMSICNAQYPVFATKYELITRNKDTCGSGYNYSVLVCSKGFNQEDSVIGNRCSFDMGLQLREEFVQVTVRTSINNSTVYMKPPLSATHRKMSTKSEIELDHRSRMGKVYRVASRGALDDDETGTGFDPFDYVDFDSGEDGNRTSKKPKHDCFHAIQRNGFPRKGALIEPGDVILGRVNKEVEVDRETGKKVLRFRDASVISTKRGVIADIVQNINKDQHVVLFRLHTVHSPDVGDKVTSRSGQKGTIGSIENSWDLLFSRDGVVPNIIMNPHAFPSRMTLAHILESMAVKLAMKLGLPTIDGTSFSSGITMESVGTALEELGYAPGGEEEYYCGKTGRRLKGQLFSGIVFYKVLKHLSGKKRHTRGAKGPLVVETRQPTDGRKREGGFRLGEMDRDCIFGHGAAYLYQNLTSFNSDAAVIWYCRTCGHQTNPPGESDNWATHRCSHPNCQSDNVVYLYTTWSHNVLFHQFRALNIKVTYDILRSIVSDHRVYNKQKQLIESDSDSGSDTEEEEQECQ